MPKLLRRLALKLKMIKFKIYQSVKNLYSRGSSMDDAFGIGKLSEDSDISESKPKFLLMLGASSMPIAPIVMGKVNFTFLLRQPT
jgi:hypothetical protein